MTNRTIPTVNSTRGFFSAKAAAEANGGKVVLTQYNLTIIGAVIDSVYAISQEEAINKFVELKGCTPGDMGAEVLKEGSVKPHYMFYKVLPDDHLVASDIFENIEKAKDKWGKDSTILNYEKYSELEDEHHHTYAVRHDREMFIDIAPEKNSMNAAPA